MKKNKIVLIVMLLLLVTGCGNEESTNTSNSSSGSVGTTSSSIDVDTTGSGKLACTREAVAGDGIDVDLSYAVQYKNGYVQLLHSVEKITSNSSESLDEYEEAYKKIAANYEGLKYYDTDIVRTSTTVTNDITINYEKLDMNKLIEIEGEEDNVIENGKVKLETWLNFAKKFGTTCEKVE